MIEVSGLRKQYLSTDGDILAIEDVSFSVEKGEFVSIIGPSGSGKSTLIKIIGNIIEPTEGRISVNGLSPEQARKKGMFSFVFQNPVMLPWRRVIENVRLPQQVLNQSTRDPAALLKMVGLEGFEHKYPGELSGGMQQRVALARALTFDPDVLLMDEPFGAVDELTRNELNLELLRIWDEIDVAVLFVTHSIAEAVYLSDRVIVLTRRPARIAVEMKIPYQRPRQDWMKDEPKFQEIVKCLRDHLD